MVASSMRHHMERLHGIVLLQVREVEMRGVGADIYKVLFPRILKLVECLVEGCTARANVPGILSGDFMYRQWKSKVAIIQEGPELLLWCDQCGMHILAANIFNYRQSYKYHKATKRKPI